MYIPIRIGDLYIGRISNFIKGKELNNVLEIGAGSDYIAKGIYKNNKSLFQININRSRIKKKFFQKNKNN